MTMHDKLTIYLLAALPTMHQMSLVDRAKEGGPIGIAGLGAMCIAIVLGLYWLFCLCIGRRSGALLPITALVLAVAGYLGFEKEHISLNLAMRYAQIVRDDCQKLMNEFNRQAGQTGEGQFQRLASSEFPPSITKLGAKSVVVGTANVEILIQDDPEKEALGFLYAPQKTQGAQPWLELRPTWYRDFYVFRKWLE
jgi:hypothetical protein